MSVWVDDVELVYPNELLKGRLNAEGNLIGLIYKDPLILEELNFTSKDFLSVDGRFYFNLATLLHKRGVVEFSEVAILSNIQGKIVDKFQECGGYKSISELASLISIKNKDSIIDSFFKYNVYIKLHNAGFDLISPITINNRKVSPIDYFKNFEASAVIDWYEVKLSTIGIGYDAKLLEDEDLEITDDFIERLSNGEEQGVSYATAGLDMNGDTVEVFPFLSNQTLGFIPAASHYIAGFSSSGKTAMMCSIIMSLISRGEKVLIICNEQSSKVWKLNMLTFILLKHFHYTSITKSSLMSGRLSPQDMDMLNQAKEYFNDTVKGNVHFIQLSSNDINVVKSKIRVYALQYGYSTVVYDTFKIGDTDKRNRDVASWEDLVQASRDLDIYAKKYNLIMLCSIQLAQSNKGALFLDSNMLSGAKAIVEQLDTLLCIRDVYKEELSPESKFYCNPYRLIKDENGKWKREDYICNPDDSWKMIFLAKSRNSENSTSSQSCLMFKFQGQYAVFSEKCWARPKHGYIQ